MGTLGAGARAEPRRAESAGFTLVELMVALVITSLVVGSLFTISKTSTDTFNQQQRASEMQLRVRFAMEQLRVDVQRASFMTTPNSVTDSRVCPRPMTPMVGIEVLRDTSAPIPLASDNLFVAPKVLRLMGNFTSADEYQVAGISGGGGSTTVYLQNRTPQWARVTSLADMNRIFPAGTALRITNSTGVSQFVQTASGANSYHPSTSSSLPSILLAATPSLLVIGGTSAGGSVGCGISGLGVGATLSPVTMVEYRIGNLAATQGELYPADSALRAAKTDLIRTEFTYPNRTMISGSQRIIAEYAVDLDIGVAFDVGNPTTAIDSVPRINSYAIGDTRVTTLLGTTSGSSAPQAARTLTVRLSVRDRDQDPAFGWVQRSAGSDPLTRFRVLGDRVGAARVRTLITDIVLPNQAARNLR